MSWDDFTYLRQENYATYNGKQAGRIEHYSELARYDGYNANNEPKSKWALKQNSKMLPSISNSFPDEETQNGPWVNFDTQQVQNWKRTDLQNLENIEYSPSTDRTSSESGSVSVSFPPSLSMSTSISYPEISRNIDYDYDEQWRALYSYNSGTTILDGMDDNCTHGGVTGWVTDRPTSGDNIAPSYYFGKFLGDNGDTTGTSNFIFFNYYDINNV